MNAVDQLELVIRYPDKKPPYVGILFQSSFTAGRTNQGWVNNYKNYFYQLRIEPLKDCLMITLSQKDYHWKYSYLIHKYDERKIQEFLLKVKNHKYFNFGHVVMEYDNMIPVRTSVNMALWVLKIDNVEFLKER